MLFCRYFSTNRSILGKFSTTECANLGIKGDFEINGGCLYQVSRNLNQNGVTPERLF